MIKRISFDVLLLAAVFYFPWWLAALGAFVGAFSFASYYEIFAFGVLFDIIYGVPTATLHGLIGIVGATIFYFLGEVSRNYIRPMHQ